MKPLNEILLVRCPECGEVHNFPKNLIGVDPEKVECAACGATMFLARRESIPPEGLSKYEFQDLDIAKVGEGREFGYLRPSSVPPPIPMYPKEYAPASTKIPNRWQGLFFDENDDHWLLKKPLLLGKNMIGKPSKTTRRIGKAAGMVILALMFFFGFVFIQNIHNPSNNLVDKISFAFSPDNPEPLPDVVSKIQTTVGVPKLITSADGDKVLVVTGEVHNDDKLFARKNVVIRARLMDQQGNIHAEVRTPCGGVMEDQKIKTESTASLQHYYTMNTSRGCDIPKESVGTYQVLFDSLPDDFDQLKYKVDVQAITANYAGF